MKIADFSIKHPVIIIILLVTVVLFSIISFTSITSSFLPDIEQPTVSVVTIYPGVGPEKVNDDVTEPLEDTLATIPGLKEIEAVSYDSVSVITMNFPEDQEVDTLLPIVREKINMVSDELPEDISGIPEISVTSVATFLPVYSFIVESDADEYEVTSYIENIVIPTLTSIKDVNRLELTGGRYKELRITLNLEQMEAKSISVLDVYQLLQRTNITIPAGSETYRNREVNIRTSGEFSNLQEIRNLVTGHNDGGFVYLKDIADVSFIPTPPEKVILSGGKSVPYLEVYRKEGGDTIKLIEKIEAALETLSDETGGKVHFQEIKNDSMMTNMSISTVVQSACLGTMLAIFVIFLFLHNIRATIIIGISIPLSILICIIGFNIGGMSLNLLSLAGLTVALGMMVDPSIVVLENITRHFKLGKKRKDAASIGTAEIGGAVVASTTTTLCVFIPLLFLTGVVGIFLGAISKTLLFALVGSLLVAIVIIPFLSSRTLKTPKQSGIGYRISGVMGQFLAHLDNGYRKILFAAMKNTSFVLFMAIAVLLITIFSLTSIGTSFIPPVDTGELEIAVTFPDGYLLEDAVEKTKEIEQLVYSEVPELKSNIFIVENASAYGLVQVADLSERERSIFEIIDMLQKSLSKETVNAEFRVQNAGIDALLALSAGGHGFIVQARGNNLNEVIRAGKTIESLLAQDPAIINTEMNVNQSGVEIVSDLMLEKMGSLGITPYEAGLTNRILFNGEVVGKYETGDNSYDINLVSEVHGQPVSEETFEKISLISSQGEMINFSSFSQMELQPAVTSISRVDRLYSVEVSGMMNTNETGAITARMNDVLSEFEFPIGVNWEIKGASEMVSDSIGPLFLMLGIAVFLVYVVMVIQFERFIQPLIIMASIPFCLIGVVASLRAFGSTISLIPFLGIIALAGIVVNNAIVLVDYTNFLRREKKMPLMEAILEGGSSRIQPILMTTFTTMLGVLPMALGGGEGSDIYAPLGQAIFGGLITSTLITLIMIPVLYYLIERRQERILQNKPVSITSEVSTHEN